MDDDEFFSHNEKNIQQERENHKKRRILEIKKERFSKKTEDKIINWVNKYCDFNSLKEMRKDYSIQSIRESGKKEMQFILDSAIDKDWKRNLLSLSSIYENGCLKALLSDLK